MVFGWRWKRVFKTGYLDLDTVNGFYVPEKSDEDEHVSDEAINIFFNGDMITISQEDHVVKYLTDKFVTGCVKNKVINWRG